MEQTDTIIIPNKPVHLCAARDTTRYAIAGVCYRNGWEVATDGRRMVAAECKTSEGAESVIVPVEAYGRRKTAPRSITVNGEIRAEDAKGAVTVHEPVEGEFPPCADIVNPDDDGVQWVAVNAKMLAECAEAVAGQVDGSPAILVVGVHCNPNRPVRLMSPNGDALGVLMPCTVEKPGSVWNKAASAFRAAFSAASRSV